MCDLLIRLGSLVVDIPVVKVVVEGGTDTIDQVHQSLTHGIPVVLYDGTGKSADILAYAYKTTR